MGKVRGTIKSVLFSSVVLSAVVCMLFLQWDLRQMLATHIQRHTDERKTKAKGFDERPSIYHGPIEYYGQMRELEEYRRGLVARQPKQKVLDKVIGEFDICTTETTRYEPHDFAAEFGLTDEEEQTVRELVISGGRLSDKAIQSKILEQLDHHAAKRVQELDATRTVETRTAHSHKCDGTNRDSPASG